MLILAASHVLPICGSIIPGGAVAVHRDRIVSVGKLTDIMTMHSAPVLHYPDAVIMPGLVNAHTHLELTHFHDWRVRHDIDGSNSSFVDWIIAVIRVKKQADGNDLALSLQDGLQRSLQNGTTMIGDILSDRRLIPAYAGTPLSGRVYFEFVGQNPAVFTPMIDRLDDDIDCLGTRLTPGISPHAPYTVSEALLVHLRDKGRDKGIPLTMHLAESAGESALFSDCSGEIADRLYPYVHWEQYLPSAGRGTATAWLDSLGVLGNDFLAVHGVHLCSDDLERLRRSGSSVVLAPRSNQTLGVGKAPAALMVRAGIQLALGTDSLASCSSLSVWDEIRFLLDSYPGVFTPMGALSMATMGGARALGLHHEAGSLETGKRADLVIMEVGSGREKETIPEALLAAGKVREVWCAGRKAYAAA